MKTKICAKCKHRKLVKSFYWEKWHKRYSSYCVKCRSKYNREWENKNPQKFKIQQEKQKQKNKLAEVSRYKIYYQNHKIKCKKRNKNWVKKHREHIRALECLRRQRLKLEVMTAYGGKCKCCGETKLEFLTIDHLYGEGRKHTKIVGSGSSFYYWLKHQGFPKDKFQILCMNCNFSIGQHGYCPHYPKRKFNRPDKRKAIK